MSAQAPAALALGWIGLIAGLAGVVVYVAVIVRQPQVVRMLNGSGLLFTSLALTQAKVMVALAQGPAAFAVQASVALLVVAVIAQSAAGLRNRRAWDGTERRRPPFWGGGDRRPEPAGGESA